MKPSRVVIKLGGASLQDETVLATFTQALKEYLKFGYQAIVVHGGGPAINQELTKRQITWNFYQGQRVTTPEMINVIEQVLFNHVNSQLVQHLQSEGLQAKGLSGAEQNILLCSQASTELGLVGNIEHVNRIVIENVLQTSIPVIAPVGVGPLGEKYNINADWAASRIASALEAEYLIFLTDQKGILNQSQKLIPEVCKQELYSLIDNDVVQGGMLTKTRTILSALESGVRAVRVMNGRDSVNGLWSNHIGTWCMAQEMPEVTYQELIAQGLRELRYVFN